MVYLVEFPFSERSAGGSVRWTAQEVHSNPWGWQPGQSSTHCFTAARLGGEEPPTDTSTLTQCPTSHKAQTTLLHYFLKYNDKKVKPWNLWNILPYGQGRFVPSPCQKRTVLCFKASLHRISRALTQHYLIAMVRHLGSNITIHKTFPHLATIGKSYIRSCKGNLNFSFKTILEMKQKTVIGGLTMHFSGISVMEIITV